MRAEPPSHGCASTTAPRPWCSFLKRAALSAWLGVKRSSCEPPDYVAHIVRHKERLARVESDADRAPARLAVGVDEAAQHLHWLARRTAIREGNENDVVAAQRPAIPRAVLADERAPGGENEAQGGDVVAERVVGLYRL